MSPEEIKVFQQRFSLTFKKIGACFTKLISSGRLGGSSITSRLYLWEFESDEDVRAFEAIMQEHQQNCIDLKRAQKSA